MTKFFADDYFHIGQMHIGSGKPCQDYSFSEVINESAFAIVSDGCSTGRHTDIGARIIALSTVHALQEWLKKRHVQFEKLNQSVTQQHNSILLKTIESFNLQFSDLLATCLYVCLTPKVGLISIQGDGVVAKVYRDGSLTFTAYRWNNNTPLYPAYAIMDNYRSFVKAHGDDLNFTSLNVDSYHQDTSGGVRFNSHGISLGDALQGVVSKISEDEIGTLSFVAVFTDGVMQVEGIYWKDAVLELLAFKNLNGEFAKRRMIRFIKDSRNSENKKGPLDDISYAVIRIGHEESKEGPRG